jgi:peptidoglycan/xylan/chitin deacetylase (PgdA/CDA1 family)
MLQGDAWIEGMLRICKILISALVWLYDIFGSICAGFIGYRTPALWVVLYYHSIPKVQKNRFSRQMDVLVRMAEPVALDGQPRMIKGKRYASVTFDDGFVSYLYNALPELIKRQIPSVIFVPSGWLGKRADWQVIEGSEGQLEYVISAEQVKELSNNSLVSIGSHCVSHRDLGLMENGDACHEILKSREDLSVITGKKIRMLSFPFGRYNEEHLVMAKNAGYERIFSILPVPVRAGDEFVLGRTPVAPDDSLMEFRMKLAGAYRWLPRAYALKAKFRDLMS